MKILLFIHLQYFAKLYNINCSQQQGHQKIIKMVTTQFYNLTEVGENELLRQVGDVRAGQAGRGLYQHGV